MFRENEPEYYLEPILASTHANVKKCFAHTCYRDCVGTSFEVLRI